MTGNTLAISLTIPASQELVWRKIANWQSQGDWMLQTKVWVTSAQVEGVGTTIAAFTGPLHFLYPRIKSPGLLDLMMVTRWEPPHICDVKHIGTVLKGSGRFALSELSPSTTRFDWSETIEAPKAVFLLIAPLLYIGVRISLARFARTFT